MSRAWLVSIDEIHSRCLEAINACLAWAHQQRENADASAEIMDAIVAESPAPRTDVRRRNPAARTTAARSRA
jgi:hypothetical protein